jgi:hypothetical protein
VEAVIHLIPLNPDRPSNLVHPAFAGSIGPVGNALLSPAAKPVTNGLPLFLAALCSRRSRRSKRHGIPSSRRFWFTPPTVRGNELPRARGLDRWWIH